MTYKNLHLQRENIDNFVSDYAKENDLVVREIQASSNKKRITLGAVGIDDCIVDLHLNRTGTTTVQWKMGKNQELGEGLAKYLKATINPDELKAISFSLKGITADNIDPIIDELTQCVNDNGDSEFLIENTKDDTKSIFKIKSNEHDDTVVVTHFVTTNKLVIQGKTLFTYRRIIYLLSELLDLNGLQSVLSCTDEQTVSIVRNEIALDYLKGKLPNSYDQLPASIRDLMCSGCCVKLASPKLPEYSMLLFPDLRALEGIIKTILSEYGLSVDGHEYGFGGFFTVSRGNVTLQEEFRDIIVESDLIESLELAYAFFKKHRHTLFHMNDFADASRKIDTLDKALSLSSDSYAAIDKIYRSKV